jgi:hypothetical protein
MDHALFKLDAVGLSGDTQHQLMNITKRTTIRKLGLPETK